jgi:hypothetical protein
MSKWKARLCTALLVLVLTILLTTSFFVKNYYGITLYQIIIGAIGYLWIGERIEKFYKWLLK